MAALRKLAIACAAAVIVPWLVGRWAHRFVQFGFAGDAERASLIVDYAVVGALLASLSLLAAYACGLWVVSVMQGPQRRGDPFPTAADDPR